MNAITPKFVRGIRLHDEALSLADAQQANAVFLVSQATRIEQEVYARVYDEITYPQSVPVDTSGPAEIQSVTYFSSERLGKARWMAQGGASDVPNVEVTREKFEVAIQAAAVGYEITDDELGLARLLGRNLDSEKGQASREAYEEMVEDVAYFGAPEVGFDGGLFNKPGVNTAIAAGPWAAATPAEILAEFNGMLTGIRTDTRGALMADTVRLPLATLDLLGSRMLNDYSTITLLQHILENNVYTRTTGKPLDVRVVNALGDDARTGATNGRMAVYKKDPRVLKLHIPMPYRLYPPHRINAFTWQMPAKFRVGGLDVKHKAGIRYLDGLLG